MSLLPFLAGLLARQPQCPSAHNRNLTSRLTELPTMTQYLATHTVRLSFGARGENTPDTSQ